ncbi:DUF3102 domain-containing protein [Jeotgalibaca porci]|uniref:DUF3102 domain-containing protein n=1 Tax=Jeotgalibaca porci TaxID=1868793 RepID=UPI0035A174F9
MNEIALSGDIKQIELEINHHKNIAGQSIWEIGRRLNHVKENDLAHGEFIKWVESNLKMDVREAQRFMKVASELPNTDTWSHLGGRALYLISTLPEEDRTKEHTTEKGETKTPDEMSVRELQGLKKQLNQQAEQHQRQLAEKDDVINKTYEQLEKAQRQQPKVVERTVEKFPDDYEKIKQENEQLKQSNQKLQRDLKWVRDDLSLTQTQYNLLESSTAEAKELERKIQSLQTQEKTIVEKMEAVETFYELESNFNDFFDTKMAPMRFKGVADHLYATNAVDRIRSMITQAELWAEEMNKILPNKNMKILEGEIIND